MHLKELTLRGFKSFASATTLRFEPGITAVVGPNGSGKSNIVDALTWVMGEQGAKNLRGTSMEDVIFAGTSTRPPLGRAQVSLTIDNSDHVLDIDYSEVTISRTIFRNGGSEYAINGTPCRLLDIQELLSDTGLGQQMHVIVGQGRLDAILRADSSGHRAFIEEAAGILKHRKRKERALRKLSNTESNLARLDDLLREIHRQLGPLRRQAAVARRADAIQVTVRDAQARLYADDAFNSLNKREITRNKLAEVRTQLHARQQELTRIKLRIEEVESLTSQSNPRMTEINRMWQELTQIEERLRSLATLAQERSRSMLGQIVEHVGDDPDMLERRAAELAKQRADQEEQVGKLRMAYDEATEYRADTEKKLASMRQTLTQLRTVAKQHDEQIASLKQLVSRKESAMQLASSRIGDYVHRQEQLTAQLQEARQQLERSEQESQQAHGNEDEALDTARQALGVRQDELEELERRHRDIESHIIALQAKADALNDTVSGRNASGDLQKDEHVHALGMLTDFVRVREGWEEAIAQALGAFSSAIVVQDQASMLYAVQRAHDERLGKAVMLHPLVQEHNTPDASQDDNTKLSAASLISVNPHAQDKTLSEQVVSAVRSLVAHTACAQNRVQALALVKQGLWDAAITQDGEIFRTVAAIGGSSLSQSNLALVARRDQALERIVTLKQELQECDVQVSQATLLRDQARHEVDRCAQAKTEVRIKAQQAAQQLRELKHRVQSLEQQIQEVEASGARVRDERSEHEHALEDLNNALHEAMASPEGHADFEEMGERERDLQTKLDAAREKELTAKVTWNDATKRVQSLERQSDLLKDQAKQARERRIRVDQLNRQRKQRSEHALRVAHDAVQAAAMVQRDIEEVVKRRERIQSELSGHDAQLKSLRSERNDLEPQVDQLVKQEHALDVERERLATVHGQLVQRVSDELGMGLEELVQEYGPDKPVPVLDDDGRPVELHPEDAEPSEQGEATPEAPTNAEASDKMQYRTVPYVRAEQMRRLEKARKDLTALGKVNPLAAEEFESLQSRNQYLHDQRNDVAQSRDDLMQLIKDLDTTMVEVFAKAFEDTAVAFQKVFATLFPGGTGRLRLENPEDLLTTGVLVEASPAGKRVKQLSLLSGGERSLTALALLFAIFTARPSPFYVMDEVEAALDDINLSRLLNALNELRKHAQLIVITHQQRTMSIADALYGITMRSDGVTAVVSQKLERSTDDDSTAV